MELPSTPPVNVSVAPVAPVASSPSKTSVSSAKSPVEGSVGVKVCRPPSSVDINSESPLLENVNSEGLESLSLPLTAVRS